MPDIDLLNILTLSYKTIGTEKGEKDSNCSTYLINAVSSTAQIEGLKGAVQKQRVIQTAMQT